MAAKRTSDRIPLCHPLPLTRVALDLTVEATAVTANATGATDAKTGVEMEALTATSIALLTIYDMAKALDKNMTIEGVRLLSKTGGKSGDFAAPCSRHADLVSASSPAQRSDERRVGKECGRTGKVRWSP